MRSLYSRGQGESVREDTDVDVKSLKLNIKKTRIIIMYSALFDEPHWHDYVGTVNY